MSQSTVSLAARNNAASKVVANNCKNRLRTSSSRAGLAEVSEKHQKRACQLRSQQRRPSCVAEHLSSETRTQESNADRRTILVAGVAAALACGPMAEITLAEDTLEAAEATAVAATPTPAPVSVPVSHLADPLLAYEFDFPVAKADGSPYKWVTSREPERYSSAAPISADARQRFVMEKADYTGPYNLSVAVGPIPPMISDIPREEWKPMEVVQAVLTDKSTARVTSGQRVTLNIVEEVKEGTIGDTRYWWYEHVKQGSPTPGQVVSRETYRHNLAVTAMRGDYLYTLNLGAPDAQWEQVEAGFRAATESFRLATPGKDYVPPEQDWWRFW